MSTSPAAPHVILLVDDQRIIAELVRRHLRGEEDLAFHYCQDPEQALAEAERLRPALILQDLVLPTLDGVQLTRQYRASPVLAHTPVLLLTSADEVETRLQALEAGVNEVLLKLPDRATLLGTIRHYMVAAAGVR